MAVTSAASAWAVGSGAPEPLGFGAFIEHWNGSAWTLVPSPSLGAYGALTGVTATSARNAWAVGYSSGSGDAVIEHWDGTAWR